MPYVPPSSSPVKSLPIPLPDRETTPELQRDISAKHESAKVDPVPIPEESTQPQVNNSDVDVITPGSSNSQRPSRPLTRLSSTFRKMSQSLDLASPSSLPSPSQVLSENFAQARISDTTPMASKGWAQSSAAQLGDTLNSAESSRRPSTESESSLPALSPDPSTSASSSSIASLAEASTPATSFGGGSVYGGLEPDSGLLRYREGIYAYTRGLYLQAKLSSTRAEKKKEVYSQFGVKQSGMERLAAKKAMARRMNA